MMRKLTTLVQVLGVLIILSFAAISLKAEPMITLGPPIPDQQPFPLPDLSDTEFLVGEDLSINFTNATQFRFTDFHFTITEGGPVTGNGGTFFSLVVPTQNGFDLFQGSGTGIGPGDTFSINFTGLTARIAGTFRPTIIPEPTTIFLLGTGLAGIGLQIRKRRQTKEDRQQIT